MQPQTMNTVSYLMESSGLVTTRVLLRTLTVEATQSEESFPNPIFMTTSVMLEWLAVITICRIDMA